MSEVKPSAWAMERAGQCWDAIDSSMMAHPGEQQIYAGIAAALDEVWEKRGGDELVKLAEIFAKGCTCHFRPMPVREDGGTLCLSCRSKAALAKAKAASGEGE